MCGKLIVKLGIFFFFQAEDGIRDIGVTGVQTCALPISVEGEKRPKPNFEAAAAKLGVTKEQIKEAFGPRPRRDLAAAASKLGISEEQLKEALGVPENPPERPE